MNAQELFLDVVNNRFLDGESTIAANKPAFYSDEQRRIRLAVRKVKNNKLSAVTPSPDGRYKMRLGNATLKLADATDIPTAPAVLITAIGSVVTAAASQATGLGIVATYSPVTASFEATVSTATPVTAEFNVTFKTAPAITALFNSDITFVTPITANITASILTVVTQFVATTAASLSSATFFYVSASSFSAKVNNTPNVFSYLNTKGVAPNLYNAIEPLFLTAQMNSPLAATFSCSIVDGSVSTISLVGEGQGYPDGTYKLAFSGGGATAGTVTATAEVTTTGGEVETITLISGGSGYGSAPAATLFTPDQSLSSILPTNFVGTVNGRSRFTWAYGRNSGDRTPIRFTKPNTTSIVTKTSVPSAFLEFVSGGTWEINIVNNGYGYISTPSVTHDDALVSTARIKISKDSNSNKFSTTISTTGSAYISNGGLPIIPSFFLSPGGGILGMAGVNMYQDIPQSTTTSIVFETNSGALPVDETLFDFNEQDYANKTFYGTITGSSVRNALIKASTPALSAGYNVVGLKRVVGGFFGGVQQGGGLYETEFEVIDYGASYGTTVRSNLDAVQPIFGLQTGTTIFQSPVSSAITIPLLSTNGFSQTILSQTPTVATRLGSKSTEYFISRGGFGFVSNAFGTAFSGYLSNVVTQTTTAGGLIVSTCAGIVTTANFLVYPKAYINGTYDCEVQSPTTGTTAKIQLVVSSTTASVVILDGGSGYTSPPIVTAPTPNAVNGYVSLIFPTNNPSGYTAGVSIGLLFSSSPATGGTAEGEFALKTSKYIYASGFAPVGESVILNYQGVSTDPYGKSGVRNKYDPPIPTNAKIVEKGSAKEVARRGEYQSISEQMVTYAEYRITNPGFGYTTPPTVLAEAPSKSTRGEITSIRLANKPVGYNDGVTYECSVATSPIENGTARLSFALFDVTKIITVRAKDSVIIETPNPQDIKQLLSFSFFGQYDSNLISSNRVAGATNYGVIIKDKYVGLTYNEGFGYVTAPTITAPTPDSTSVGQIIGLKLTNTPVGYRPDNKYQLTIGESPRADGRASAEFSVSSLGVISAQIVNSGFGYTTKPTIVAPAPDLDQGLIAGVSVSTLGRGFAAGEYICNITDAPLGGETASVAFNVNELGVGAFQVVNKGRGYVTAPLVSVPTQSGNIIKSITISCKGSYYEPQTALFSLNDSSGSGVSLGSPILSGGRIQLIPVIAGGYGYSNTPEIQFSAPTEPVPVQLDSSFIEGDFNITTASANAILSTSTQRDILMEVYETDGTNEQVVAQATVSLAKRVLE